MIVPLSDGIIIYAFAYYNMSASDVCILWLQDLGAQTLVVDAVVIMAISSVVAIVVCYLSFYCHYSIIIIVILLLLLLLLLLVLFGSCLLTSTTPTPLHPHTFGGSPGLSNVILPKSVVKQTTQEVKNEHCFNLDKTKQCAHFPHYYVCL